MQFNKDSSSFKTFPFTSSIFRLISLNGVYTHENVYNSAVQRNGGEGRGEEAKGVNVRQPNRRI